MDARFADAQHPRGDLHLPVVPADLVVVVEIDVAHDEPAVDALEADTAHELGDQPGAGLLQQLVVDGLVEVPEEVDVAPAQRQPDIVAQRLGHGARVYVFSYQTPTLGHMRVRAHSPQAGRRAWQVRRP